MGEADVCMWCRPGVQVVCSRCGIDCPGAYDGLQKCAGCRATPLGTQQYEDKQRARYTQLVQQGVILPDGTLLVSLAEVESLLLNAEA